MKERREGIFKKNLWFGRQNRVIESGRWCKGGANAAAAERVSNTGHRLLFFRTVSKGGSAICSSQLGERKEQELLRCNGQKVKAR